MAVFFCKDTQEEVRCVIIKKIQTEKNTVTKIVCNKCKKEITIKNGIPEEEMLTVEKRWGYFRTKTENSIDLISVRNVMIPG